MYVFFSVTVLLFFSTCVWLHHKLILAFKTAIIITLFMSALLAYLSVGYVCLALGDQKIPWNWGHRQLRATVWVGTEPGSSLRTAVLLAAESPPLRFQHQFYF